TGSKIEPITIKRYKSEYNSDIACSPISSATAVRGRIFDNDRESVNKTMPGNAINLFYGTGGLPPNKLDNFSTMFHYILKTKQAKYFSEILDISEGLENRIIKAAETNFLISSILKNIKTKRYTYTKLQRAILHIILGIEKGSFNRLEIDGSVPYIRVLGFRKNSAPLLTKLTNKAGAPVITNLKNAKTSLTKNSYNALKKEMEATDLYYLALNKPYAKNIEYHVPLVII
ncbi:MAG: nucleotidyltransferase family protein, partial [Clostridiales bacterium]|nr:nucleotidyltransferase family protein [Clostridiales bacterium]